MRYILFLAVMLPLVLASWRAGAANVDIIADALSQDRHGVVTGKGHVVIRQWPQRIIQDLRITALAAQRFQADFTLITEPSKHPPQHRRLILEQRSTGWKITRDQIITGHPMPRASAADESDRRPVPAAIQATIEQWRQAWNRHDLEAYTDIYAEGVYPLGLYQSREAWLDALRRAFAKAPIRTLAADKVIFDRARHQLRAEGHVEMVSGERRIVAKKAEIDSETHAGRIEQATLMLPGGERLQAATVTRVNDALFEAADARFSACPANEETWSLEARRIRLDLREDEVTARGASFKIGGVPVLYSPWWSQPLKRKSGLLIPRFSVGKRRGTELGIPVYFAPADNWDATLTPTWMSARGVMGELEFRHLSRLGRERIDLAGIRDTVTGNMRSRLQSDIAWHWPKNIELAIHADHVSDHWYLADYGSGSEAGARYLSSVATLSQSYVSDSWIAHWLLSAQHQQDLTQPSNASVLQILPRFESSLQWRRWRHFRFHLDQQTTRFARRLGVDGWRIDLHPYLELPWSLAGGGLSANLQAGGHFTRYELGGGALTTRRQQRTTKEVSLELRSDFERISFDRRWRHQISPVLRYDYIQAPMQSGLVNFDSSFAQLTWSNLLRGNRFSGRDRIEKVNRISAMLESRLQHKDGLAVREILLFRAGAAYDMLRQSIDPALQPASARPFSNLLGELSLSPMKGLRLFASGQYNPVGRYWATLNSGFDFSHDWLRLHAGYQLTDARYAPANQSLDLHASVRLGQRWQASGQWWYDRLLKMTQQTTLGLKYSHPCWSIAIEGYRLNRANGTTQKADAGARFLLEFRGLGSVGSP